MTDDELQAATPATYLSRSEGKYRVIHQGLPICPDQDSPIAALAAARYMGLQRQVSPNLWDGDAGRFVPFANPTL